MSVEERGHMISSSFIQVPLPEQVSCETSETGWRNKFKTEWVFKQRKVKYLGHAFSNEGLKVDPGELRTIAQLFASKNKAGVQRF